MTQTFNVGSRSLFVTVTAWVFIVLGLLASASALVQNAVVSSLPGQIALSGKIGRASCRERVWYYV